MKKRPNPAVAAAERIAKYTEDMADIAESQVRGPAEGKSTAEGLRALAERRRATANKIKRLHPYLISNE